MKHDILFIIIGLITGVYLMMKYDFALVLFWASLLSLIGLIALAIF